MILSNLRANFTFLTLTLVLCFFIAQSALANPGQLPESLHDILRGNASDLTSAASELKDTDLPAALAIVELLKFKALHQETAVTPEQINKFELLIKNRLKSSPIVSFFETATCRSKVNTHEIQVDGQKVTVPEYYVANVGLIITDVIPAGEAGTVFPDIQINFVSQSPIAEYSLNIDGNTVPNSKISVFDDDNEQGLIFRSDLNVESILSIGTHTAEISISNEKGDQAKKHWTFTVGVYDTSEPPVPDGATIVKELQITSDHILPGSKVAGNISVIIYQDKNGRRYTSYKLVTPSGMIIESGNLAFIARRLESGNNFRDNLVILPKLTHAFPGHPVTFSYEWSGPGTVTGEEWEIDGVVSPVPSAIINGNTRARCRLNVEIPTESGGTYNGTFTASRFIRLLTVNSYINSYRQFHISSEKPYRFELEGKTQFIPYGFKLTEGAEIVLNEANTGIAEAAGLLKVNRLHWKIIASDGSPVIETPSSTETGIVFSSHGFAEVVFDIDLEYSENGETQKFVLEPQTSALYAFYKADAKVELDRIYPGQLTNTRRPMNIKTFEFKINNQSRTLLQETDCSLESPVTLCASTLWPASAPIQIKTVFPLIAASGAAAKEDEDEGDDDDDSPFLERLSPFRFYTRPWAETGMKPLWLYCYFLDFVIPTRLPESRSGLSLVGPFVSVSVFKGEDILELQLDPDRELTAPEGLEVTFKAALSPLPGYGTGKLAENSTGVEGFNILDGYKIAEFKSIDWFEDALWLDNDDWATGGIVAYSHVFNPLKGFGKYAMRCRFDLKLEESVTKDSCSVLPEAGVTVNAVPGLRILSPIDKLAYPLNQTIKVTTTMDSEEHAGEWENIKWKLNGKDFDPPVENPAFPLLLNKAGKWKLEAELKTIDPNTGKEITLKDASEFEIVNVEISLTPEKIIINQTEQKTEQLKLSIIANGTAAEKPGVPFVWQRKEIHAVVDPVKWQKVVIPDNSISADLDPESFLVDCDLKDSGAATFLATVTIRITDAKKLFDQKHKRFKDEYEEPVFSFPVVRADLWAVKVGKIENVKKYFPDKAIAQAYRTYDVASFSFEFSSSSREPHSFDKENGLQPKISLKPALPGDFESISADIGFNWKIVPVPASALIEQELVKPCEMVTKPSKPCSYNVAVEVNLDFDQSTTIKLGDISTTAQAVDLFSLIVTKVDPASFAITIGETKTLKYIVSSLEQQTTNALSSYDKVLGDSHDNNVIYLLDNSYALNIENVEWSDNQDSQQPPTPAKATIEGNPYEFHATVIGKIEGEAIGNLRVTELYGVNQNRSWSSWLLNKTGWGAESSNLFVKLYANGEPIENNEDFYFGQQLMLTIKLFKSDHTEITNFAVDHPKWQIEAPVISTFFVAEDLSTGNYYDWFAGNATSTKFYLFDYDQTKTTKTINFNGEIITSDLKTTASVTSVLKYKRPIVIEQAFDYKAPRVATHPVTGVWTLGFDKVTKPGIRFYQKVLNETGKTYDFNSVQLIKIDCTREIGSGSTILKESLKTFVINDSPNSSDFWLDAGLNLEFPTGLNRPVETSNEIASISVFNDSPYVELKVGVKDIRKVSAKMEFQQFVLAKISQSDSPYFPIGKRVLWSWEGTAIKKDDQTWEKSGELASPIIEMFPLDSFLNWYEKSTPGNPKWLEMEDTNE